MPPTTTTARGGAAKGSGGRGQERKTVGMRASDSPGFAAAKLPKESAPAVAICEGVEGFDRNAPRRPVTRKPTAGLQQMRGQPPRQGHLQLLRHLRRRNPSFHASMLAAQTYRQWPIEL